MLGNILHAVLSHVDYSESVLKREIIKRRQVVIQIACRSGLRFCRSWSGPKLFTKVAGENAVTSEENETPSEM